MTWRLRILTAMIIIVFAAGALAYFRFYVAPPPHGVILFIAPGVSTDEFVNAFSHDGDTETRLPPTAIDVSVIPSGTQSHLERLSAVSTGRLGPGDTLGLREDGIPSDNLSYQAQRSGRAIGMVTTDRFTHPASAAFYAHTNQPENHPDLILQLFDSTRWNILLGGHRAALDSDFPRFGTTSPAPPADSRNLIKEARLEGYQILDHPDQMDSIPRWRTRQLVGAFRFPDAFYDPEAHSHSPTLDSMVTLAIECLQFSVGGYFLVVVSTDVAAGPEADNPEFRRSNIHQLGQSLRNALDYSDKNSSLILYLPGQYPHPGLAFLFRGKTPLPAILTPAQLHQYLRKNI